MSSIPTFKEFLNESDVVEVKEDGVEINEAKLYDEETKKEVKLPYKTKDFRGDPMTVVDFIPPKHAASSGRIKTKDGGYFFPGVAGLKIVESLETVIVNEEYVEVMDMPRIANALGEIKQCWDQWKTGPMTEPYDIKPAQKELKSWITNWLKKEIK